MDTADVGKETKKIKFEDRGPGSYLLKSHSVSVLYGIFLDIKDTRRRILALSSNYDHEGFKDFKEFSKRVEELTVYRISTVAGPDVINPTNSNSFFDTITKFLEKNGKSGVAATDSFERLRTVNGFDETLKVFYRIRDFIGEGMFVFHVDPRTLKGDELARVEGSATYVSDCRKEEHNGKQENAATPYHG
ncbi:MAG TPA: DUF835 domain-containing protein [archaeon]|nr:DUF835 domain-containing protein [archaeon]